MGTAKHTLVMEDHMANYGFGLKDANVILKKTTENVTKSNKCTQCDFASSEVGSLRTHVKTHTGERSNKCNQCDYASSKASNSRTHLKMHSEEK